MTLPRFVQWLRDAPLLHSVAWGMLPPFAQLLGGCSLTLLSHWGMLPCFAQSLGGCSLALLSHWGDAPSLRSVAGGCFLALLSHWGTLPRFAQSLGGCSLASLSHFPFNGSIKLLQNLHSRGSLKQHFYIWEPRCGYLLKVKKVSWCPLIEEGHRLAIILENVLVPS